MSRGNRQTAEFNFHESLFPKIPRYQFKVWGIGGALGEEKGTGRIGKRKKKRRRERSLSLLATNVWNIDYT